MKKLMIVTAIVVIGLCVAAQVAMAQTVLTGHFVTIWPNTSEGEQPPRHFLIDKVGKWVELKFDDDATAMLYAYAFNRKQVTVEGSYEEPLATTDSNAPQARTEWLKPRFRVRSILPDKESSFVPMATGVTAQAAITGSKPWATLLCKFADSTRTTPRERPWFDGLMTSSDYPSMDHFWRENSYGQVDFVGSRVFGWHNLPHPRAHYVSDTNGDGVEDADLRGLAADCAAAADAEVYFPQYEGIDFVFNEKLDCCAWGGAASLELDGSWKIYGVTWLPPWALSQTTVAHERGHAAFSFGHSSGPYNTAYDSQWDPMSGSFFNCGSTSYGCISAHTISFHKEMAGWIPIDRQYVAPQGSSAIVEIERLAQPAGTGYLMVKIPINGSTEEFYTVETRQRAGYDGPLPDDVVLIHHVDTANRWDRQAQVVDVDNNGDPNDAAAMWVPGETFIADNGIKVSVVGETARGFMVLIENGGSIPPSQFTLAVSKSGNGTVTASGIHCGSDCQESFSDGTVVSLTAYPDAGWTFSSWSGDADCSDGQVVMSRNIACVASFAKIPAPDLVGQFTSLTKKVKKGRAKVSFAVSVSNVGDQPAQTPDKKVWVAVYLSSDAVLDGSDQYLKAVSAKAKKGLAPWQSVSAKGKVTLPEPCGGKYLIAVVDPWGQVPESDEYNNIVAIPIP